MCVFGVGEGEGDDELSRGITVTVWMDKCC